MITKIAYLQLKRPSVMLASVCPPRIQLRMEKPVMEHRLKTLGMETP